MQHHIYIILYCVHSQTHNNDYFLSSSHSCLSQIYFEKVYSKHFVEHTSYTAKNTTSLPHYYIRMCRKSPNPNRSSRITEEVQEGFGLQKFAVQCESRQMASYTI